MDRKLLRIRADFQGKFRNSKYKWLAGITLYNVKTDTVDIETLNKGRNAGDLYPSVKGGLFGQFVQSGLLSQNQIIDCHTSFLKFGVIYDTRDNESNPMHGIWSDLQLIAAPGFLANDDKFIRLSFAYRQYFTIIPDKLSLATRISFQNKISGTVPFYMLPFVHYLSPYTDEDGLGGNKTLRGILKNRIVGDGIAYGNVEFRWKFLKTVLWKQNIYFALSVFADGGLITQKYKLQNIDNTSFIANFITNDQEKLHISAGAGFHIVLNENFIVSADYGQAFDKRDGLNGIYIGLDFLF
jgi:outer membrane protein assembly factor BamA